MGGPRRTGSALSGAAQLVVRTRPELLRRGIRLEWLTVTWNIGEGLIAVAAGLLAGSPALVGFGVDSGVETISGAVLLWRLRTEAHGRIDDEAGEDVERRAERLVGVAFLVLGAYVAFEAARSLLLAEAPQASPIGIALATISIAVMLWLARLKRATGEALGSRALVADAKQTYACWYLSVTTLVGLAANALFGWWWADPAAALMIVVLLVREGREALRGRDDD